MFERFTTAAREVVKRAVTEAERRDSPVIGVEHVLLALHEEPESAAALRGAGLGDEELAELLADVERAARRGGLGEADAEALRSIGIDLDAIVDGVEATHGPGALAPPQRRHRLSSWARVHRWRRRRAGHGRPVAPPAGRRHRPFTPDAKRVLERSLREAVDQGSRELRPVHILLGVATGDDPVGQALAARGVTPIRIRSALGRG